MTTTTKGQDDQPTVNWFVFGGSSALIVTFAFFALLAPETAASWLGSAVAWISKYFGWWYFVLAAVLIVFVILICLSPYGRYRLGPPDSKPQYSLFTWTAMLFAAGIGGDLMFYAVAEPVAQYIAPPTSKGETVQAAEQAVVWTLFHYGLSGWAMYAVMGMAIAFFAFRKGLPLSIRSALYPLFGKKINGRLGDTVDVAAVLGTVFGLATSLGITIALLNAGLQKIWGVEQGKAAQLGLVIASVILVTISAVSGLDKGIRRLSELDVVLSLALLAWVFINGEMGFLMDSLVQNVGDYFKSLPGMSTDTMAFNELQDAETIGAWKALWTLFFWAWWVAWVPFVGLFLARISRGRTIRQFLVGVMAIPFTFILLWVGILGNSALARIMGGDKEFAETASGASAADGFYAFLDAYPAGTVLIVVATLTGFLFYVTSADSGALVLGNLSSRLPNPLVSSSVPMRIFWSIMLGLLTIALMWLGGDDWLTTLTGATIIMGLPFSIVLALVTIGLFKALRCEGMPPPEEEGTEYAPIDYPDDAVPVELEDEGVDKDPVLVGQAGEPAAETRASRHI